ncbi:hypothetical protein STAS_32457 [Striga asiatica]|uniref:Transmembrane protein n=1 Tax=Striga asiatica TaxID=4170 RepID=A0A5A7RE95_STRAF|nr:hypothetical protein STAS_32457 [Striga asiatica]
MSQPLDQVYQNPMMTSRPESSHSNGSFGPVFVVLAVIVVISAVACVLGRFCSKRHNRAMDGTHKQSKPSKQSHGLGPKEWESRQKPSFNMRDGDIEFGFEKKIHSGKGAKNGGKSHKPTHFNGAHGPEIKFANNVSRASDCGWTIVRLALSVLRLPRRCFVCLTGDSAAFSGSR